MNIKNGIKDSSSNTKENLFLFYFMKSSSFFLNFVDRLFFIVNRTSLGETPVAVFSLQWIRSKQNELGFGMLSKNFMTHFTDTITKV